MKFFTEAFKAQLSEDQDAEGVVDTWIDKDVSPYGLIQSVSKDMEMVLIGYGTGAKTKLQRPLRSLRCPINLKNDRKQDKTIMTGCNPLVLKACEENGLSSKRKEVNRV